MSAWRAPADILNEVRVEVIKHGYYGRLSRRIRLPRIFGKILMYKKQGFRISSRNGNSRANFACSASFVL